MAETIAAPPWEDFKTAKPPWQDFASDSFEGQQRGGESLTPEEADQIDKVATLKGQILKHQELAREYTAKAGKYGGLASAVDLPGAIHSLFQGMYSGTGKVLDALGVPDYRTDEQKGEMPNAISPEQVGKVAEFLNPFPRGTLPQDDFTQGIQEGLKNMASGLTSLENLSLMAVAKEFPGPVGAGFAGTMVGDIPAATEQLITAKTPRERGEATVRLVANVVLPKLIQKGLEDKPVTPSVLSFGKDDGVPIAESVREAGAPLTAKAVEETKVDLGSTAEAMNLSPEGYRVLGNGRFESDSPPPPEAENPSSITVKGKTTYQFRLPPKDLTESPAPVTTATLDRLEAEAKSKLRDKGVSDEAINQAFPETPKFKVTQDGEPAGVFSNEAQANMVASGLSGKVEVKPVTEAGARAEIKAEKEAASLADENKVVPLKAPKTRLLNRQFGTLPKGTEVTLTGEKGGELSGGEVGVILPDGTKRMLPAAWLKSLASAPKESLGAMVTRLGRPEVERLIGEWDSEANLSPDGKTIDTLIDSRNKSGKTKGSIREFQDWLNSEAIKKLEGEAPLPPAKASQEFDRLIVEHGLQLDWVDKPDALFAEIGKAQDTASIKAKLAKGKALQAARRKAAGDLGLKPDDVDTVAGRARALDVLKKHIEERNAPDTLPETENADTSFLPEEKPAQVIPKLRPGEKATGDLFQGEDAPFNLAGETAVDTERVAREKADAAKKTAEAKAAQEKQQPGLIGMGGAVPGEFEGENNFVSNMFAAIDRDRAQMGKEPMADTQRRSWDEDNQKALARMNRNPQWIPDLIAEVTKSPRPLLSWENAGMVWQRHLWKAEANNALARIAQAFDDGRTADLESAKLDAARYEEKLEALDKAVGRNGTGSEAGRSLQAQKMAGGEDFTLVEMRLEARKSLGGRPLTEAESAEIKSLHDKLARNEIDITAARGRIAQLEIEKAAAEARAQPSYSPGVLQQAERFVKKLESGAEDSAKWLREHMGRTSAGVDPTVLYHVTKLGAAKFARGAIELAKWTDAMAAEVGEWVREKAQDWFEASKKLHDEQIGLIEKAQGKVFADKVKKAVTDIPGRIDAAKASIKGKVDKGTTAIAGDVQKLFKAVVEQNPTMKARELADVMHGILKESMPDITWQETIDAISGRGKFWRPSQEVMAKKLRDLRQQLRLIGHEIDVEEKRPLPRTGMQRDPMSADALAENKRLSELKRKYGVVVTDPKTQLTGTTVHSALRARKTAIAREIAELQDRIAKSDFSPKPKRTIVPDSQLTTLQTQKARLVKEFRQKLLANEMANRSRGRRVADLLLRIRREFILSGISSIGKLFSYSAQEFGLAPPKEAAGAVLSKVPGISQIAERAPSEVAHRGFGSEVKGMINDYVAAFTKGIKDAKDTWATGESELKARLDPAIRPEAEFRAFFGTLHQMEKSPLIRFGFERSFRRRMESASDRGLDVSDVGVQQRIAVDAYQDALRGALINRNAVVNRVNRFITSLEEKSKTTGRTPALATAAKFAFSSELPVQHVPANYVARTAEYIFGLGTGSAKAAMAFRRGIETLQPAEADQIMRHLKSGAVGSAAMLTGFLLPKLFGGLWTPGGKKNDQLKPGEVQAGPVKVRYWATHEQVLNAAQFGATVRKISETKHQGLSAGAQAALWGLADEVPYARELSDFAKAKDPRMAGKFWEEKAKGYLIPQGVSQLAELLDMNEQWRTVKRTPHNVGQALESGIPGLRQKVPTH